MTTLSENLKDDTRSHDMQNKGLAFKVGYMLGWQRGTCEALLQGILVNLQIKFGDSGQDIFPEFSDIADIGILMSILEMIRIADSPEDIRYLRHSLTE
jgi:hypothetical protein